MTQEAAITLLYGTLPYSVQIKDLDLSTEKGAIYFTWRSGRFKFRFDSGIDLMELEDGCLAGSDKAILIREMLKMNQTL